MMTRAVFRALGRARIPILTIALTYSVGVTVGIIMVHAGNEFALSYRDNVVANSRSNPALIALEKGERLQAAILDFGQNLLLGAVPTSIGGLAVVVPYPVVAYSGWVGGIVSVNNAQISRLANPSTATYYISVLILQLTPYSLTGGAGVNLGLAYLRPQAPYQGEKWFGLPKEAVRDLLRIYLLAMPLFLIASLFEFLLT